MNKRFKIGRRKADWLLPITLFIIALAAVLWAQHNYTKRQEAEQQKEQMRTQVQLYERLLKQKEKSAPNPKQ